MSMVPIFIGGVPRSGTSLLQKIIGLNNDVYAAPEFQFLPRIGDLYKSMVKNKRQESFYTDNGLNKSFREFIEGVLYEKIPPKDKSLKYFSEKTPDNILAFDSLSTLFPEAKFLIIVRNPKGNINSFKQVYSKARSFNKKVFIGNSTLKNLGYIKDRISIASKFYNNNRDKCYVIFYEDLLENPEREIEQMCAFIGLDYISEMIDTSVKDKISEVIALQNNRDPWYDNSMYDRKIDTKRQESWKRELHWIDKKITNLYFTIFKLDFFKKYDFKIRLLDLLLLFPYFFVIVVRSPRRIIKFMTYATGTH